MIKIIQLKLSVSLAVSGELFDNPCVLFSEIEKFRIANISNEAATSSQFGI